MNSKSNYLEYSDDFTSTELNSDFWSTKRILDGRWQITEDIAPPRGRALQVSVHPGDLAETRAQKPSTERAELSERSDKLVPSGVDVWYAFSLFIPEDFRITDNRLVFAQWKQEGSKRSPALALRCQNGKIIFSIESNEKRLLYPTETAQKTVWHRLMVHHHINENHQGTCEAFLDGVSFASFTGSIGHPDDPVTAYFKMGLYRDHVEYIDTLYFANFRRGLSREFCES